jgi:hypothetical protein
MYKVARRITDTKGCSTTPNLLPSPLLRYYKLGETTKAWKGSAGIFCFSNLDDAGSFAHYWISPVPYLFTVFKVEPLGPVREPDIKDMIDQMFLRDIEDWHHFMRVIKWWAQEGSYLGIIPKGTIVTPAVRCVSVVPAWDKAFYHTYCEGDNNDESEGK